MIGAMPAVAVRHERKRQEKRLKRPSQLYLGGQWMPPPQGSPPTPSPHGHNNHLEPLPELYLCGKVIFRLTYKHTNICTYVHYSDGYRRANVNIYWSQLTIRYASWVNFMTIRTFDFCALELFHCVEFMCACVPFIDLHIFL